MQESLLGQALEGGPTIHTKIIVGYFFGQFRQLIRDVNFRKVIRILRCKRSRLVKTATAATQP